MKLLDLFKSAVELGKFIGPRDGNKLIPPHSDKNTESMIIQLNTSKKKTRSHVSRSLRKPVWDARHVKELAVASRSAPCVYMSSQKRADVDNCQNAQHWRFYFSYEHCHLHWKSKNQKLEIFSFLASVVCTISLIQVVMFLGKQGLTHLCLRKSLGDWRSLPYTATKKKWQSGHIRQ